MRLTGASVSEVGPRRSVNQDAAFTASWGAAVADGVGGGPAGDLASAALVHRLVAGVQREIGEERLHTRIRLANWDLRAHTARDSALAGMATTLTGVFVDVEPERLLLAHVGDSRAYRLRGGDCRRMTRDDSYVQELVDRGIVAPENAWSHPRRNIITASYSGNERDIVRIESHDAQEGDRWLLCSDGVTDYVPEDLVADVLRAATSPADAATELVRLADDAGSADNITAVIVDVQAGETLSDRARFSGAASARFCEEPDDLDRTA
ncbi:protein phosphatase 2C domain-containing protein [Microbacterium sp. 1P10UB]|uniref:PP2C family protein-serine/threonine phosphatase n=1 Tax=unclassified Microbacterium TaxID=2609290 RepID=UPI0039A03D2D